MIAERCPGKPCWLTLVTARLLRLHMRRTVTSATKLSLRRDGRNRSGGVKCHLLFSLTGQNADDLCGLSSPKEIREMRLASWCSATSHSPASASL